MATIGPRGAGLDAYGSGALIRRAVRASQTGAAASTQGAQRFSHTRRGPRMDRTSLRIAPHAPGRPKVATLGRKTVDFNGLAYWNGIERPGPRTYGLKSLGRGSYTRRAVVRPAKSAEKIRAAHSRNIQSSMPSSLSNMSLNARRRVEAIKFDIWIRSDCNAESDMLKVANKMRHTTACPRLSSPDIRPE